MKLFGNMDICVLKHSGGGLTATLPVFLFHKYGT